ncbi:DUF1223 domain-containing protein [Dongia sp.]|uniref:DUF1223 domain-containing protein n=1 Tax=Dongia sp. TaxID=1977262 RepID=UPI0035AE8B4E
MSILRRSFRFLPAAIFCLTMPPAAEAGPAVVELFTSQGCSSCPPADANLGKLARRTDVLALSFGVTYWDYLGWQDTFGKPEFTERQHGYARALGNNSVYTPQMVVNGRTDLVGHDLGEVEAEIAAQGAPDAAAITLGPDKVAIGAAREPVSTAEIGAEIWLVRYEPGPIEIPVARGENGGRELTITHAVRELTRLGIWQGAAMEMTLPAGDPALKRAILIQGAANGAILAAATD